MATYAQVSRNVNIVLYSCGLLCLQHCPLLCSGQLPEGMLLELVQQQLLSCLAELCTLFFTAPEEASYKVD